MLLYISANVQEKRKDEITTNLGNQAAQLDKLLQQAYQIGQTIAGDEVVNRELSRDFSDAQELHESEIKLNSLLLGTSGYFDEAIKIYIVGENGGVYKDSPYSLQEKDYKSQDWYKLIKEIKEPNWFELHSESFFVSTAEKEFVSLAIPVTAEKTGRMLGSVMVEVAVSDILRNSKYQEEEKMRQINLVEGKVVAPEGMKVGIVAARFNEIIVNKLLGGAVDGLVRHGVEEENITAAWVPGAFEIPITAQKMAQSGKYDAIICVGAVIRGDTSHYDLVCNESAKGIAQVELATGIPVLFGVITTENIEQAIARAGSKAGNKGYDCALSAIEMVNLMKQL